MYGGGAAPILVLSQNTKRESGRKVQLENISAGKAIADVIRTCLGPQAMLKMLMDPMGGIVMTNDGNAILREITVQHPAGKSMIEIARTQDEEVGDGTTSVIVLAGEMLAVAEQFLEQQIHPTVIIRAYRQALEDAVVFLQNRMGVVLDVNDRGKLLDVIKSCVGTKFIGRWADLAASIALDAAQTVLVDEGGRREIDIKRYAKVEKVPGATIEESTVLKGVMINKDVTHPKMRRRIENPRIVLLDCTLEYKKGESQTNIEIMKDTDFTRILELEEEQMHKICEEIIAVKPDVVFTEKGISDLAQHYLLKAGISAVRRVRKSDNNRIARACGATVVNRTDELREEDVGTKAGLFEIKKLGDEYFCFVTECKDPKACTILLRGASKDVLNETERNLQDALHVARNIMLEPKLVPGGGAVEMATAQYLTEKGKSVKGVSQWPYRAVAQALEIIPRTLIQNCGGNTIRTLTALRAKHATGGLTWGINGETGELADMKDLGVWEPLSVKLQTYKTAVEAAKLDFVTATLEMMVSANIPIEKADYPAFRSWMRQNVVRGGELPGCDTLRREYLPSLASSRKEKVIDALKDKTVAVMSDETTDKKGRAIFVVILTTVEPTDIQEQYVASVTSLEEVNGRSCARAISDALQDMKVEYSQVVAFVSDGARYMKTCFDGLSILLSDEVIRVQCWAHKIHLRGELLKGNLAQLNQTVIAVKHIFLTARKKRSAFKQFLEDKGLTISLFPIPVPTRWNSWLKSVEWLADNWEVLFLFLQSQEENESNRGSKFLHNLKEDEASVLHVECEFVKSLECCV